MVDLREQFKVLATVGSSSYSLTTLKLVKALEATSTQR